LFVLDRAAITGGEVSASNVMDNDLMKRTKAYDNDRIIYVDSHVWYVSSGGITGTLKMVEDIQSALSK
jgi:iron complex transport system substrate-binding protein